MEQRLYYQLSKTQNTFRKFIKRTAVSHGIKASPTQLGILFLLKEYNNSSMSFISKELDLDNSAITRCIDNLENLGFVRRTVNSTDRRAFAIEITKEGLEETEKARVMIETINKQLEKKINRNWLTSLHDALKKLEEMLN